MQYPSSYAADNPPTVRIDAYLGFPGMFARLCCVRADHAKLTRELALDAFGACREAMLRTSPSIEQASSNSLLRHPELLACQSGAAFTSVGSRGCMRLISSAGKHHLHPTSVRALRQKLWLLTPARLTFLDNLLMAVSAPRMLRGWPGMLGKTQPFLLEGTPRATAAATGTRLERFLTRVKSGSDLGRA